jgi:hypothetical protein
MMMVNHMRKERPETVRLYEGQVLEVMVNCIRCHTAENAKWLSGGHSATYADILLDERHNKTEQLNFDCLRCHGMYSDVPIHDLVEPLNITGPWKLKDASVARRPVIPCQACHRVHAEGSRQTMPDYSNPGNIFYRRSPAYSKTGLYYRPDKIHITVENLPKMRLWEGERQVKVSDDPRMSNCIQCHAPDARHQAGTSDDRTPRGVHEGLSCLACHDPHSNDARPGCLSCHPAISNCKLDVTMMNTSYHDPESPNDIHWVACSDCHKEKNFNNN